MPWAVALYDYLNISSIWFLTLIVYKRGKSNLQPLIPTCSQWYDLERLEADFQPDSLPYQIVMDPPQSSARVSPLTLIACIYITASILVTVYASPWPFTLEYKAQECVMILIMQMQLNLGNRELDAACNFLKWSRCPDSFNVLTWKRNEMATCQLLHD